MPCSLGQGQILNLPQMCISPIRANGPAICLAQPEGLGTDPQYHKGLNARPFATRLHNRTFTVRKTNDTDVYADVGKLPGRWPSISHSVSIPALQPGLGKLPGRCPCFKFDPHDHQGPKTNRGAVPTRLNKRYAVIRGTALRDALLSRTSFEPAADVQFAHSGQRPTRLPSPGQRPG